MREARNARPGQHRCRRIEGPGSHARADAITNAGNRQGGKLTVDDLIELRCRGVDAGRYIDAMRGAGLGELSLDEIAEMKAVPVSV